MLRKAYIVWNEAKTEGVIFVDDDATKAAGWPLTAADDAFQAMTGNSRQTGLGSALAEAFNSAYEDEVEDGKTTLQAVEYEELIRLPHWPDEKPE